LFGGELLVVPVTQRAKKDGYARVKAWLPKGKWIDIFNGAEYTIAEEGKELVLLRDLESIPVFIKEGGIVPLSLDKGNLTSNPTNMEIFIYSGNGEYELYEDGAVEEKNGVLFTRFKNSEQVAEGKKKQILTISTEGDWCVVPERRKFTLKFKDIQEGDVKLFVNDQETAVEEVLTDCTAINLTVEKGRDYRVEVVYTPKTYMEKLIKYARYVLTCAEERTSSKDTLWKQLVKCQSVDEYVKAVEETNLVSNAVKLRLKETL
jgi:hypothetical protein